MKNPVYYYSPVHKSHKPEVEFTYDEFMEYGDVPARIESIRRFLQKNSWKELHPKKIPEQALLRVHNPEYLEFLKEIEHIPPELLCSMPFVAAVRPLISPLHSYEAKLGYFISDTGTPVYPKVFHIARTAAAVAYQASQSILKGERTWSYALCRPPGHHAGKDFAGGYCYLNNAAVAAAYLATRGKTVILDLDYHHGHGTQDIFYSKDEVSYISIHADPVFAYPYYTGFSNEKGIDAGKNTNFNFPLPEHTSNSAYYKVFRRALSIIKNQRPEFLVCSLGLDTYRNDPLGSFLLTADFYQKMGKDIKDLNIPIVVVQEGGYNKDNGKLIVNFFKAFL